MSEFPYRTAMVTGASGGIGEALARQLAARGVDVVLVARRADLLKQLADELREQHGVHVDVLALDLTDDEQCAEAERRLADPHRPVELLVNNAGSSGSGLFAELPLRREMQTAVLNAVVPLRLTHAVLPPMIERGSGGVLNISSMSALLPRPRSATYGASKAFLSSLGETLAMEAGPYGVQVTTVHTGLTRSGFHQAAGVRADALPDMAWLSPEQVAEESLAALVARKPAVVPGRGYRMRYPVLRVLPRWLLRRIVRREHQA
ncbi:MAG: SDR family oxidoreductase [Streptomyces sp.]|nr:SDR family oxidoreductase [Streptomyces sp.]